MTLTDEQIANLTPQQITALEEHPDREEEILAGKDIAETESEEGEPEQEEDEGAANGAGDDEDEDEEEDEPVVLTKDGKRTIPYSELKATRVENAALKEQLEQFRKSQEETERLRTKLNELQSIQKQMDGAKTTGRMAELQEKFDQRIAVLKEDFPDAGAFGEAAKDLFNEFSAELDSMKAANKAQAEEIKARVEAEKARAKEAEEAAKRKLDEQVQEAKENNPDLSYWEKNDTEVFEEAVRQEQALLLNPKWRDRPIEERFIEVVKRTRAVMPDASEPPNETPSAKTKEKAKAKLDKAAVRKPTTLSDIKGGGDPLSEKEQMDNLSPGDLFVRLMKMPDDRASAMRADLD